MFFLGFLLVPLFAFVVYLLPSAIAFGRRHPYRWQLLAMNLVLGTNLMGWIGALVWSLFKELPSFGKGKTNAPQVLLPKMDALQRLTQDAKAAQ